MTLAADACGGPNPLVSLGNSYRASTRVDNRYENEEAGSSHVISDLLKHVRDSSHIPPSEVQSSHPVTRETPYNYTSKQKKSLNQCFSEFAVSYQTAPVPRTLQSQYWRPYQKSLQHTETSGHIIQNKKFEEWVRRYHPEVLLKVKASDVVDVELSHELAEEWLKDFHLNDVIKVESLSEAENIVEQWIREFRLGREAGSSLSREERVLLEKDNEEYRYLTKGTETSKDIDIGIDMIKQGDLLSAISVFEDIVKQDKECGEAWYYLGLCNQQSENEHQAISAFNNVEEGDMCYPSTLLGLAASYLNEYKHHSATDCLAKWLHVCHPGAVRSVLDTTTAAVLRSAFTTLPRTPHNDVEIQTALGILSCLLDEPHVAVDHFRAAVAISPQDFMLWNRLGATLANSERSSESVEAYRRALSLSPGYIRARYNLGIACLNLRAYREGIEHFLTCLKQQDSDAVWQTLRLALSLDRHYDSLIHVDRKSLQSLLTTFGME